MRSVSRSIDVLACLPARAQQLGWGWGKGRRVVLTIVERRPEKLRLAKAWLRVARCA
jgi:hypothetical protein